MKLTMLVLEGFTCFRERIAIDFSNMNLFAICGDTGSGKSSIIDGIIFALYGRTPRLGKSYASLISQGLDRTFVSLEFLENNKHYKITRIMRQPKKTVTTDVLLEIFTNTVWSSVSSGTEKTNAELEKILGLSYEAFTKCIVLPQGQFQSFLQESKERQDILMHLLGLEILQNMQSQVSDAYKEASFQLQQLTIQQENDLQEVTEENIQKNLELIDKMQASISQIQNQIEQLEQIETEKQKLLNQLDEFQQMQQKEKLLHKQVEELEAEKQNIHIAKQLLPLASHLEQVTSMKQQVKETEVKIEQLQSQTHLLQKQIVTEEHKILQLEEQSSMIPNLEKQCEHLHTLLPQIQIYTQKKEEWNKICQDIAKYHEEATNAKNTFQEAQKKQIQAEQYEMKLQQVIENTMQQSWKAYADNTAHVLRQHLVIGKPCPVCSSIIKKLPETSGTQQDWHKLDEIVKQKKQDLQKFQQQSARNRDLLVRSESEWKQKTELEKTLQEKLKTLQQELKLLEKNVQDTLQQENISLKDIQSNIISAKIKALQQKIKQTQKEYTDSIAQKQLLQQKFTFLQQTLQEKQLFLQNLQEQEKKLKQPIQSLAETLHLDSWELLFQYQRSAKQIEEWEQMWMKTQMQWTEIKNSLADLELVIQQLGLQQDSFENLQNQLKSIQKEKKQAQLEYNDSYEKKVRQEVYVKQLQEKKEQLSQNKEQLDSLQTRTEVLKILKNALQSNAFPKYVFQEILNIICEDASEQLQILTDARYILKVGDKELCVIDSWNQNKERACKTLSGGETFLVSLALSLALSERLSQMATDSKGVHHLECLFLDEGFDTLDEDHLSLVLKALKRLQTTGKMIGIISHLPLLTNYFPERLEVTKSKQGSKVIMYSAKPTDLVIN